MKTYSQFKEDIFLTDIFKKKKISHGFFLEFGAWDGIKYSNCKTFVDKGWKGLFIEGDIKRFQDLKKNYENEKNIICLNEFIDKDKNNLDQIVEKGNIKEIDILSIDIDGKDLPIWKTLNKIKPKVVVIEFNLSIPFDMDYEDNVGGNGSSFLAINNFAKKKDYELIYVTATNLIFISKKFNNGEFEVWSETKIMENLKPLRLGFNNYGEMLFFLDKKLENREVFRFPSMKSFITFQPVPRFIRKITNINGQGYKVIKILYSNLILLVLRPNLFIKRIFSKIIKFLNLNK